MNRARVPADHLVDQDGIATPFSGDRVRLATGDWVKISAYALGLLFSVLTAWYTLREDVRSVQQEQIYSKTWNERQDMERERLRTETLQALKEISAKLDNPRFRSLTHGP